MEGLMSPPNPGENDAEAMFPPSAEKKTQENEL